MSPPQPVRLNEAELVEALTTLAGWTLERGKLHREYAFEDFIAAFGFMTDAAQVAQAMDHHPEWFNVFNTVRIDLTTHDAGGVTALDVNLAQSMEAIANRRIK
jgi:4a-hydroxytetrahydrobiopterin dehydratase